MRRPAASLMTRLYPSAWRRRYGAEFAAFLEEQPGGARAVANVVLSAIAERLVPTVGGNMDQQMYSFGSVSKKPAALIPLAMSGAALLVVAGAVLPALLRHHAIAREPDEGTAAHLWQLLMTVQMPVVLFFAVKWLKRAPRQTLGVLALQAGAWLAACAPVYFLHL
ncbi:MAG TPA: hypothetical protein VHU44_05375 [Acidobacteriaceae bacterium]|nr:hypothetical protein [Acidobacteriaceae bacterium]